MSPTCARAAGDAAALIARVTAAFCDRLFSARPAARRPRTRPGVVLAFRCYRRQKSCVRTTRNKLAWGKRAYEPPGGHRYPWTVVTLEDSPAHYRPFG
ncbi:hypothetical protein EVAR_95121_1 [Eumeta japonica]|uniref:Uncharacterized protein n=1 Tax=Eumeta variegata TaxID=151549 RepID=A0A4C1W5S1_EUMVA|nr:hypothetical protein EVAR_95121_1 [Eumeta japonica]